MIIIKIIIYIFGCIGSYFLAKKEIIKDGMEWSISDRRKGIFLSLFSWFSILAILIQVFLYHDQDRPAKW